ncbi:asparaginase [Dendrothele bispora CBS 962.96]|uniref:Asparaginase n=1 Tax=Dendrothele bispora (strain CBS 962.96) TaxID=1314807 RepID=A0A4S8MIA0_DENBC|nr:asparaginase [Dendrothele bispora CBS 962.96]
MPTTAFVAVHAGAGYHSLVSEEQVKKSLRLACRQALSVISHASTPLELVEEAISALENDPSLNAGHGSNLTIDGTVECDAALMEDSGRFGSVGAVSGIKNPIRLARSILDYSQVPDPLGRVPPLTLVSEGARAFAQRHPRDKVQLVQPESLISEKARERWQHWKRRLESTPAVNCGDDSDFHDIQDTVGAVASFDGHMSAGVSSGGLLLKCPGRTGEAAVYGAGCWAQPGMACSISGTGEYITRANLARSLGRALAAELREDYADPHEVLEHTLTKEFWDPSRSLGEHYPNAGVLLMTAGVGTRARLWCAFTTPTMAIAYASSTNPKPKVLILRRPQKSSGSGNETVRIFLTAFAL